MKKTTKLVYTVKCGESVKVCNKYWSAIVIGEQITKVNENFTIVRPNGVIETHRRHLFGSRIV
jgi:hypothetical protein